MRRFNILMFFSLISMALHAQFVNNGATVTIQPGATLRVETDFINTSGIVTNNGTLEVKGNFTNNATFTSANPSLVRFIDTGTSNVTSGTAVFRNVEMAKTANDIVLVDPMTIAGNLNFANDDNQVVLGNQNLTMQSGATITSTDANEYVATTGTGSLIKTVTSNGTVTHEIGDATNYTPISSAVTGSGYTDATLGARVVDATHPNKPAEADSYLSRYWIVNAAGISDYANTMTGTYAAAGDANGTSSRIKGATYVSPNWAFTGAATNGTSTVTGSTTANAVDFTGMNALNKLDITALLRGAMPVSGTSMTNNLQTYAPLLLPTTSPYGAPTSTYASIGNIAGPAGIVTDWVKVEVRSNATPGTILETRSLLLQADGSIVDVLGGVPYFKDQTQSVRVAIIHRNHLGILSNTIPGGNFEGRTDSYNFTTGLAQASNAFGDPDQMILKNGVYCMHQGDMNADNGIDANDAPTFLTSFNNGDFDLYLVTDINMDGSVDSNDVPLFLTPFNAGYYSTLQSY